LPNEAPNADSGPKTKQITAFPLPASQTNFEGPLSLAINSANDIYICDSHRILEYTPGSIVHYIGGDGPFTSPEGMLAIQARFDCRSIALDPAGDIYGLGDGTLYEIGLDGVFHYVETNMQLPAGVARSGNASTVGSDGNVYLALCDRVVAVGPDAQVQTVAGGGTTGVIRATYTPCDLYVRHFFAHEGYSFNGPGVATSYALAGADTVTTLSDGNIGIGVQYPSYAHPRR
jgi:hypothetical protein